MCASPFYYLSLHLQIARLIANSVDPNQIDWLCWDLTTRQPLWVILCRLPKKGRKEIEEIAEEIKERDSEERG